MFVIILGLLAAASAAPFYPYGQDFSNSHFQPGHFRPHDYFRSGTFDTTNFWQGLENDMSRLDTMLSDFYKHFPTQLASDGVDGNEYKVTITLTGFDEKDIVVKAREGVLMIQAIHKNGGVSEKSYLDVRTLPRNINVAGNWTYDKGILRIVFPLNNPQFTTVSVATESTVTEGIDHSREEIDDENSNDNNNADVGLERGDKDNEILTNTIPRNRDSSVEATTYAVDFKNDVEFVPVRY